MNREQAKKLLPFVQAYAEGKQLQCMAPGGWIDYNDPAFLFPPESYRIKPEPVVFESWHTLYPCRSHGKNTLHIGGNYNTRKSAEDWATNHRTLQIHPEEAYILHLTITDGVPHAKFIPYSPK